MGLLCLGACSRPLAKYTYNPEQLQAPINVTFNNESENAEAYIWDLGNGDTTSIENPEKLFLLSGKYDIELTAKKGKRKNKTTKSLIVKAPDKCLVQVETPYGNMIIELFEETPGHRENFTKLVEEGFYDGLIFHRVIEDFMIQGGDPNSRDADLSARLGSGGPGYQIPAEFDPKFVHIKGALAAARTGDAVNPEKKSSGSQFYIVQGSSVNDATLDQMEYRTGIEYSEEQRTAYKELGGTPFLDMNYTVFGRVIEGLEVIDKIAEVEKMPGDRPTENITMKMTLIK